MKARILTALLLAITIAAYNQTPRRSQQDKEKQTNQRTQENRNNEQKKESVKEDKRKDNNQNKESRRTYNPSENKDKEQKKEAVRDDHRNDNQQNRENKRTYNPQENKDRTDRPNQNQDRRGQSQSTQGDRRNPDNHVIVRDQNREPRQKVVIRDNRRETRTYIHIDRPTRNVVTVHYPKHYRPAPIEVRRVHYPYRVPVHSNIYWSVSLHTDFRIFYPEVRVWRYDIGYRIPVVPAYDAEFYIGDVAKVYGKVYDVYYEYQNDEYFLYFGDYFPYQDFSVVVPGIEARAYSRRPERFFSGSHIAVTGYVSDFEDKPEIVVRRASQIEIY